MTTKNIKVDYGAKGDGQKVVETISITNGTKRLTTTTNRFTSGDTGKYLAFTTGAITSDGGFALGVITFVNAKTIDFTNNYTGSTLTNSSQTIEWGTDDSPAFQTFTTEFDGQTGITLTVPAGRYPFITVALYGPFFNMSVDVVCDVGNGTFFTDFLGTGRGFFLGTCTEGQVQNDNTHSAYTQTVNAGATSLTLVTAAQDSRFSINNYALMTGWAGDSTYGHPTQQSFYEVVFITAISSGVLTLQSPLRYNYNSTWPLFHTGSPTAVPAGGPAMLYTLESAWNNTHRYYDLNIESPFGTNCHGKSISFIRGSTTGLTGGGIQPSVNNSFSIDGYTYIGSAMEADKLNVSMSISNSALRSIKCQAPNETLTISDTTFTQNINGTWRNTSLYRVTTTSGIVSGALQGNAGDSRLYAESCVFPSVDRGGIIESDVSGVGGYTMVNGIISRVKAAGSTEAPLWAIPGGYCYWWGTYGAARVFKIISVIDDGTSFHIQTTETGGFPTTTIPNTGIFAIQAVSVKDFTFLNCTGCQTAVGLSGAPAGRVIGEGWAYTYSGNIGASNDVLPMVGNLISATFNVTHAYAGANSPVFTLAGPIVLNGTTTPQVWNPQINLKIAGSRVVTPTGVTGAQSGDTLSTPGNIWLVPTPGQIQPTVAADMSDDLSVSITLTILTNQGILTSVSHGLNRWRNK